MSETAIRTNQSGRSLTEMMGTLAIMGILAIAGIWMYNSAMDRVKANTIINEAQKRAVVVAGQIGFQGRTNPSLEEFSDNTFAGGTFSTDVVTDGLYQQFGIQVSSVPKSTCQNILNTIGEGTSIRRLTAIGSPTSPITSCTDNNTLLIVYNNDMSNGGNETTYAGTNCSCQTVCGVCVMEGNTPTCVNECPTFQNQCTQNSDCQGECVGCVIPSGQSTGTCQACQRAEYLEGTGTQYINTETYIDLTDTLRAEYVVTFTNPTYRQLSGYSTAGSAYWGVAASGVYESSGNTHPQEKDFIVFEKTLEGNDYYHILFINNVQRRKTKTAKTERGNLWLFALPSNAKQEVKMYDARVYKNGTLVHNFIPVYAPFKETGKQNCLFDKVSKTLFCNTASGADFKTNLTP